MENPKKGIFGAWTQAIGTVASAIGTIPQINKDLSEGLNLWGNVLQAAGNSLQADAEEEVNLEKEGNQIQSIGNCTVVAGLVIDFEKETQLRIIITGNWLQALGGAAAIGDELGETPSPGQSFNITGNFLQSIGNSLQAIGGIYELKELEQDQSKSEGKNNNQTKRKLIKNDWSTNPQTLEISGSWIQAVGSVLSLIGAIKEDES